MTNNNSKNINWQNMFTANIVIFIIWAISITVSAISAVLLICIVANTPGNSGGDVVNEILGIITALFASAIVAIISMLFWLIAIASSITEIVFAGIAINKIKIYKEADKMWCFGITVSAASATLLVVVLYRLISFGFLATFLH